VTSLFSSADLSDLDFEPSGLAIGSDAADLLFREGRTAYAFTDEEVTDAQVRAVYDLVKWGPTALNSQPLRVVLVRSAEARDRLVPLMSGNNQARVAAAPLVAVLAADVDFHDELPRVFPAYTGAREAFAADETGRRASALHNAAIQAGYFLVGVRAAGLAAGPMGGFDVAAVSREFFPDGAHQALLVVNLGHADEASYRPRNPRLDYDEVVSVA
jgi:3-hydroxypropanoate dehydrogenase